MACSRSCRGDIGSCAAWTRDSNWHAPKRGIGTLFNFRAESRLSILLKLFSSCFLKAASSTCDRSQAAMASEEGIRSKSLEMYFWDWHSSKCFRQKLPCVRGFLHPEALIAGARSSFFNLSDFFSFCFFFFLHPVRERSGPSRIFKAPSFCRRDWMNKACSLCPPFWIQSLCESRQELSSAPQKVFLSQRCLRTQ